MRTEDRHWYKDAIIYELHVRAFHDSVGDGTGDFRGLTSKLDYLQDLGVTAIWLLPFYPSPLRDDGYDIADYTTIHPDYGTLDTFREFLSAAHDRGLRVITELVVNHTSDQHAWFQRARRAKPGSVERDFYVWSDTPEKYRDARIIFKDFETSNWAYDNLARAYYWHRFYSHQPDLNFDNPAVWKALFPVVDWWFDMGVDGLRLDAVPYLFEREGTSCENLPETHGFLRALREHVDEKFPDRMLLAEANQWPEDAVEYFGDDDECHMAFHFPAMPRLFMAMHMEDRLPIVDIMEQTPPPPGNCQWAMFLRNHDELTLEMVTDEERDYMYRAYATDPRARINLGIRRRLAPLLGNNRRRIELMNGLLFSLPGTPVLYYGDEIGMGDNIYLGDRNGVRTPMQWSGDRNAGFSRANPQKLYLPVIIDPEYHYEAVNVETQQNNSSSLLWWSKRLIGLRRAHKAFSRGTLEFLRPSNRHILAFLRRHEGETILVVANLSRFVQYVELDLPELAGAVPMELFGGTLFPAVGKNPYVLTLGPHSFYWFEICTEVSGGCSPSPAVGLSLPEIRTVGGWEQLITGPAADRLEAALLAHFERNPVDGERPETIRDVRIRDHFPLAFGGNKAEIVIVDVERVQTASPIETHWVPITWCSKESVEGFDKAAQSSLIAHLTGAAEGWLCEATALPGFNLALLEFIQGQQRKQGVDASELSAVKGDGDWTLDGISADSLRAVRFTGEQSHVSMLFNEALVLKRFRHLEAGVHPEAEIGRHLNQVGYSHAARWLGALEYRPRRSVPMTLAVLHQFVPNQGDAWQYTLDEVSRFYERVLTLPASEDHHPIEITSDVVISPETAISLPILESVGGYLDVVRLLAARLAELHVALATDSDDPNFAPEVYTPAYQRSLYQSLRNLLSDTMYDLGKHESSLPDKTRPLARLMLDNEASFRRRFQPLMSQRVTAWRTRAHGDCHLGQVLMSGKDVAFIDFEGPPHQSIGARRIKRSPLRDVTGMLRSFDYAGSSALHGLASGRGRPMGVIRPEDQTALRPWSQFWRALVQGVFVHAYRQHTVNHPLLSMTDADFNLLLGVLVLEKALVELRSELPRRADWVIVPLEWLASQVNEQTPAESLLPVDV